MSSFQIDQNAFLRGVEIGRRLKAVRNQPTAYVYSDRSLVLQPNTTLDHTKRLVAAWTGWDHRAFTLETIPWFSNEVKFTSARVMDGLHTEHTDYWFFAQTALVDVYLGTSIKILGTGMFAGCSLLSNIMIPDSVEHISTYAFLQCTTLSAVKLPSGLKTIGLRAFESCAMYRISLPTSLVIIDSGAFQKCAQLMSIDIPDSVRIMGQQVFGYCTSMSYIGLGKGLTALDKCTFVGCVSLEHIIIPSNIKIIHGSAFRDCSNLKTVVFEDPSGWWYADSADATSGTSVNFTNSTTAANILRTTEGSQYDNKYFKKG